MLNQLNISGLDKVQVAIKRLQLFEPSESYYIAFSGGKDSCVVKALADMAGVKYDAHYNHTSVDPPELIYFIREHHPDVKIEYPRYPDGSRITMWNLIPKKKMPPTRLVRYCCRFLKESGGEGRFTVTGVRWAESAKRRNRAGLELSNGTKTGMRLKMDPDNPDNEEIARYCPTKGSHILNPIIDWLDEDVWEFIRKYNIPYCKLYDQGYTRLGCIGCPMSNNAAKELNAYPKFKQNYLATFGRMLAEREKAGMPTDWKTPEDVMNWWLRKGDTT